MSRTTARAEVRETTGSAAPAGDGHFLVQLITPGWGSSGYYSQDVLEAAGRDQVWPAGTHIFFDHPSESEAFDRPERSVRDLAGITTENARWDATTGALVAEAKPIGPHRDLVTDPVFIEAVGMSIRATAEGESGEAEGRSGNIVTRLVEGKSVDLVTRAGRGGKVLAVLESARTRPAQRAVARGVAEATANDTREALQSALVERFGGDKTWLWVRDFDDATVWYELETPDSDATWQLPYAVSDAGAVTLDDGDPTEVRARTEYVPVTPDGGTSSATESGGAHQTRTRTPSVPAPAGRTTHTPTSQEDLMGNIQVDEAEHRRVTEAAGRVPTLESERDTAVTERDTARTELAEAHRQLDTSRARDLVREAATAGSIDLDVYQVAGIAADYPRADTGRLDEAALTERATKAIAALAEAAGSGSVRGFGRRTTPADTQESADPWADIDRHLGIKEG